MVSSTMESETMPITMPLYNIGDIFNLPSSMELLRDEDFEKAMMLLDCPDFQKEDISNSDLYMVGLADTFNSQATKSTFSRNEQQSATGEVNLPYGAHSCLSPDLKIQISDRRPVICDQHIKRECDVSGYSPVMESFLREHWDDIVGTGSRPVWPSLKASSSCSSPLVILTASESEKPLFPNCFTPPSGDYSMKKRILEASLFLPPTTLPSACRTPLFFTAKSHTSTIKSKSTRRAKQCVSDGCTRRAQSNDRCKTHGGGARCQMEGCDKSSQGGGLCRAHGGGKKCRVSGCSKGTQRLGLCYLHGGIRRCIMEGCKKKDRGSGYCISHGGGRRCETQNCNRSVRKRNHCQMHQTLDEDIIV